jgi:hypothetical protein
MNPLVEMVGLARNAGERWRPTVFIAVLIMSSFKVVACIKAVVTFSLTLLWKRVFLGSLAPGVNLCSSR